MFCYMVSYLHLKISGIVHLVHFTEHITALGKKRKPGDLVIFLA